MKNSDDYIFFNICKKNLFIIILLIHVSFLCPRLYYPISMDFISFIFPSLCARASWFSISKLGQRQWYISYNAFKKIK